MLCGKVGCSEKINKDVWLVCNKKHWRLKKLALKLCKVMARCQVKATV